MHIQQKKQIKFSRFGTNKQQKSTHYKRNIDSTNDQHNVIKSKQQCNFAIAYSTKVDRCKSITESGQPFKQSVLVQYYGRHFCGTGYFPAAKYAVFYNILQAGAVLAENFWGPCPWKVSTVERQKI